MPTNNLSKDFEQLNTDYHVEGSFRSSTDRISINGQLYDSRTSRLVWADKFGGNIKEIQHIQEELYTALVSSLQQQLNFDLLSQIRKKPLLELKAYECWLFGLEELKKATLASDLKAREYFKQAISIEPSYSLAYSGMSLTYFNEWSCQLWERWDVSQSGAFEWAQKAMELDDQNYISAYILGRIFLYDGAYESAEHYLRKSYRLNSNDPDSLITIASCFVYLGYTEEAYALYERAVRLNPAQAESYYPIGGFALFELGETQKALALSIRSHSNTWVDAMALYAAAYFDLKDFEKMQKYWQEYLAIHKRTIRNGGECGEQDAIQWMINVNPFKGKTRLQPFWDYMQKGKQLTVTHTLEKSNKPTSENVFSKNGAIWEMAFNGESVQLPEVKGFVDIRKLLSAGGQSLYCGELMGNVLDEKGEALLDAKAKKAYQQKIIELKQEIESAEDKNDYVKLERLEKEYDQLIDHLSKSLGLKGRSRIVKNPVEKSRSAVTWRIRSAIAKIEKAHPALGKHFSNAIRTGTFCSYIPEKETTWATTCLFILETFALTM